MYVYIYIYIYIWGSPWARLESPQRSCCWGDQLCMTVESSKGSYTSGWGRFCVGAESLKSRRGSVLGRRASGARTQQLTVKRTLRLNPRPKLVGRSISNQNRLIMPERQNCHRSRSRVSNRAAPVECDPRFWVFAAHSQNSPLPVVARST